MSQYTLFTVPAIFAGMAQIDGIKAMVRDISGAKQVIKFAHTCTSNRGQDCSFCQDLMTIFVMLNVQFKHGFCFTSLVLTVRTSMHGCNPIQKRKSDLFDP